jgi:hypothetical protein
MNENNQEKQSELEPQTIFLSVKDAAKKSGVFTEAAIRTQIFYSDQNGLAQSGAIKRIGSRVLVKWGAYLSWIDNQPSSPPVHNPTKARRGRKKATAKPYRPAKLVEVESGWPHVD